MGSNREIEQKLDRLPQDLPYKFVADLRRLHLLLHESAKTDESVPYSAVSIEDLGTLIQDLPSTKLKQALDLVEGIQTEAVKANNQRWSLPVLELVQNLYMKHFPPEQIKHGF